MDDLGHPDTSYNWGPFAGRAHGPRTRPQMRLTGAGRLHRVKVRDYTGNPVGYLEHNGRLIPYLNVSTGNMGRQTEHTTVQDLKGYVHKGGALTAADELVAGPTDEYRIGSGQQFRQVNASILSTVWHHEQQNPPGPYKTVRKPR